MCAVVYSRRDAQSSAWCTVCLFSQAVLRVCKTSIFILVKIEEVYLDEGDIHRDPGVRVVIRPEVLLNFLLKQIISDSGLIVFPASDVFSVSGLICRGRGPQGSAYKL